MSTPDTPTPSEADLADTLAQDFLRWPLPASVSADLCASMPNCPSRFGFNLLSFAESKEMIEAVVMPHLKNAAACAEKDREIEALRTAQEINDSEFTQVVFEKSNLEQQLTAALARAKELEEELALQKTRIIDREERLEQAEGSIADLRKYKERMDWLHAGGGKDPEGYEWGVARIKHNEHGQLVSAWWTDSNHADLDAEIEREARQALAAKEGKAE